MQSKDYCQPGIYTIQSWPADVTDQFWLTGGYNDNASDDFFCMLNLRKYNYRRQMWIAFFTFLLLKSYMPDSPFTWTFISSKWQLIHAGGNSNVRKTIMYRFNKTNKFWNNNNTERRQYCSADQIRSKFMHQEVKYIQNIKQHTVRVRRRKDPKKRDQEVKSDPNIKPADQNQEKSTGSHRLHQTTVTIDCTGVPPL